MLKVVSSGLQDQSRLNAPRGRPETSEYRFALRKRTRWASQWRYVPFDGNPDFGRTVTCTLPQDGELITQAVLVIRPPDLFGPQGNAVYPNWVWTNSLGHALIENIQFNLRNAVIDSIDGRLLEILDDTEGPMEHFQSTNDRLARDPQFFPMAAVNGVPCPPLNSIGLYPNYQDPAMLLHVVPPFWWNRGPGPSALPMQALTKETVQLTVSFRNIDQVVVPLYLQGAVDSPATAMPGSPLYDASGTQIGTMPDTSQWHLQDAYWLIEYISLETREAAAFRLADLQIPITQHLAAAPINSGGAYTMRVQLEQTGLMRDMIWIAQHPDAPAVRAWFSFGKDLRGPSYDQSDLQKLIATWSPVIQQNNPEIWSLLSPYVTAISAAAGQSLWWPNMFFPDWDVGDGYYVPSSIDRFSDPLETMRLMYRGKTRFELYGGSWTRSIVPALGSRRGPVINRYIYRYDFGLWPTGGLAETLSAAADEPRGMANWDKIQFKELQVWFNQGNCTPSETQNIRGAEKFIDYNSDLSGEWLNISDLSNNSAVKLFNNITDARVTLVGRTPPNGGAPAVVSGVIDITNIKSIRGFRNLWLRTVPQGSTGLFAERVDASGNTLYVAIAVAGGGGEGTVEQIGGAAGSAVACGTRGDGVQSHAPAGDDFGGAGGGRRGAPGPAPAVGRSDLSGANGIPMPLNDTAFMVSLQSTGGNASPVARGGDGWRGGGAGIKAGGGGGSFVSRYINSVDSFTMTEVSEEAKHPNRVFYFRPLKRLFSEQQPLMLHVWFTRYNMLRIFAGRAALMFDA